VNANQRKIVAGLREAAQRVRHGLTAREWQLISQIAYAVCEVHECGGTRKSPCDKHFDAAAEYFRKATEK